MILIFMDSLFFLIAYTVYILMNIYNICYIHIYMYYILEGCLLYVFLPSCPIL